MTVFLSVVLSFVLMLFMKEKNTKESMETKQRSRETGNLSAVARPFLTWMLVSFAMSSVSAFLSLTALQKGFPGIGLYFTLNVAGLVISRLTMKRITDNLGERTVMIMIVIITGASLAGISVVNAVWQLYVIGLVIGFANGVLAPVVNTKMVNSVPQEKSGFANAVFFAAGDAGFIFGPTVWGMVAGALNYDAVFRFAGLVVVLSVLLAAGRSGQKEAAQ